MATPSLPVTYRPTVAGRVGAVVALALLVIFGGGFLVALVANPPDDPGALVSFSVFQLVFLAVFGGTMVGLLRARIVADDAGVTVVNYLSTKRFRWDEIDRFEVGFAYWGITLVPRAGSPMKVNAVQKANLYHWLGVRRRADRIVDELNAILRARTIPMRPDAPWGG
jgi:hypothetical protein